MKSPLKTYTFGSLFCSHFRLTSLFDCPDITGMFSCAHNCLSSLEFAPSVRYDIDYSHHQLTSLKHHKQLEVNGDFKVAYNQLTSLEFGPTITKNFNCAGNQLTSLEFSPELVFGDFIAYDNKITSLKGIGKHYLKEINGMLSLSDNQISSHVLGILLIKNLDSFDITNKEVKSILNNHLHDDKDILDCQEELIQAGLREFAKL